MKSTLQELAKIIAQNPHAGRLDVVPPGWHHMNELASEWNVSPKTARSRVNSAVYSEKIEKKQFRVQVGDRAISLLHYSVKK